MMTSTTETDEDTITIRLATPADGAALTRVAQLDSAVVPGAERILVAEIEGELRAALPLDGGPAIADPFRRTGWLVELLEARAAELLAAERPASRRRRLLGSLRPAPAGRA